MIVKNADGKTEEGVGDGDALLHGKVNHIEACMFVSIFSVDLNGLRTLEGAGDGDGLHVAAAGIRRRIE